MYAKLRGMTETTAAAPEPTGEILSVGTVRAAEMLGLSRRQLMNLIYSGEIPTSRVPSHRTGKPNVHLIKVSELKKFLDRHENTTAVPAA